MTNIVISFSQNWKLRHLPDCTSSNLMGLIMSLLLSGEDIDWKMFVNTSDLNTKIQSVLVISVTSMHAKKCLNWRKYMHISHYKSISSHGIELLYIPTCCTRPRAQVQISRNCFVQCQCRILHSYQVMIAFVVVHIMPFISKSKSMNQWYSLNVLLCTYAPFMLYSWVPL